MCDSSSHDCAIASLADGEIVVAVRAPSRSRPCNLVRPHDSGVLNGRGAGHLRMRSCTDGQVALLAESFMCRQYKRNGVMNTLISRTDLWRLSSFCMKSGRRSRRRSKNCWDVPKKYALALNEDVFSDKEEAMLAEMNPGFEADVARLRHHLGEIEAALRRHAHETYGVCETCGRMIAVERLLSQPAAVWCKPCDAVHQHGGKSKVA